MADSCALQGLRFCGKFRQRRGVVARVVERLDISPFVTFIQPLRRLVLLGSSFG